MTELLQVEHLSKQYPGFTLQDISFSVKPGRIMGLIGKNGAGKSTTLKSILNMVRPESGTVTMLGKDFYANEKECKQDIGVVFGGIDFYPLKKLSAITAVTRRFYRDWDQERYNDYLRQFSLDENKRESVKGKCQLIVSIQLFQLLISVPCVVLRGILEVENNLVGIDATVAWYGFGLIIYAVFDLVFFQAYYKNGYKAGKAFVIAAIPMLLLMIIVEGAVLKT